MHSTLPPDATPGLSPDLRDLASAYERSLRPLQGYVILRAEGDPQKEGNLFTPTVEQVYPQQGWVVASSAQYEDIKVGDLALIEVESMDIARSYQKVFEVLFTDGSHMVVEPDKAAPIIETVQAYWANRTSKKMRIRTLDITGQGVQFETDDVLDFQFAEVDDGPSWGALYPLKMRMFKYHPAGDTMRVYYHIHESNVLAILKEW